MTDIPDTTPTHTRKAVASGLGRNPTGLQHALFGDLSGLLLHRLGTVLAPIVLAAERLQTMIQDPSAQQRLDTIAASTDHASGLVRRLAELVGDEVETARRVDSRQLVIEAAQLVRELLPARITLDTDVAQDLRPVLAQPSHLKLLVLGLCTGPHSSILRQPSLWRSVHLAAHNRTGNEHSTPVHKTRHQVVLVVIHVVAERQPEADRQRPAAEQVMPDPELAGFAEIVAGHQGRLELVFDDPRGPGLRVLLPAAIDR